MGEGVNLIFFGGHPRSKKAVANVHIFRNFVFNPFMKELTFPVLQCHTLVCVCLLPTLTQKTHSVKRYNRHLKPSPKI